MGGEIWALGLLVLCRLQWYVSYAACDAADRSIDGLDVFWGLVCGALSLAM